MCIIGPRGCGKTAIVNQFATTFNYNIETISLYQVKLCFFFFLMMDLFFLCFTINYLYFLYLGFNFKRFNPTENYLT